MNNVHFKVILDTIETMLARAMHVEMVYIVVVGTFPMQIGYFDASEVSSLKL
jgi:hypothetical protein